MRRCVAITALLIVIAWLVPAFSADDAKKDDAKKDGSAKESISSKDSISKKDSKEVKSSRKAPTKEKTRSDIVVGKLTQVEGTQRYLTVQVTTKVPQENAGAAQNLANLRQQLLGAKDANSIRNIQIETMKNQQQLVTYKDVTKNVEIQADDNMKVRTLLLPVEYDEKGRPRKLTEKEKKALKGPDATQPGYMADFDSLKPGQEVKVFLAKSKNAHKAKGKDAADSKEKPKATMILILSEPAK
jgi:hypothetical protein